jgi:hypothetical protein
MAPKHRNALLIFGALAVGFFLLVADELSAWLHRIPTTNAPLNAASDNLGTSAARQQLRDGRVPLSSERSIPIEGAEQAIVVPDQAAGRESAERANKDESVADSGRQSIDHTAADAPANESLLADAGAREPAPTLDGARQTLVSLTELGAELAPALYATLAQARTMLGELSEPCRTARDAAGQAALSLLASLPGVSREVPDQGSPHSGRNEQASTSGSQPDKAETAKDETQPLGREAVEGAERSLVVTMLRAAVDQRLDANGEGLDRQPEERENVDEVRQSAEREGGNEIRQLAEREGVDEVQQSAEREGGNEIRQLAEREGVDEIRQPAEREGGDEIRQSAERESVGGLSERSVAAVDHNRPEVVHDADDDQPPQIEKRATDEAPVAVERAVVKSRVDGSKARTHGKVQRKPHNRELTASVRARASATKQVKRLAAARSRHVRFVERPPRPNEVFMFDDEWD